MWKTKPRVHVSHRCIRENRAREEKERGECFEDVVVLSTDLSMLWALTLLILNSPTLGEVRNESEWRWNWHGRRIIISFLLEVT